MRSPVQKPTPGILFATGYATFSTFSTRLNNKREIPMSKVSQKHWKRNYFTQLWHLYVWWPNVPTEDIAYLQPLSAVCVRVSLNLARHKQLCSGRCNLLCTGDKLLLWSHSLHQRIGRLYETMRRGGYQTRCWDEAFWPLAIIRTGQGAPAHLCASQ